MTVYLHPPSLAYPLCNNFASLCCLLTLDQVRQAEDHTHRISQAHPKFTCRELIGQRRGLYQTHQPLPLTSPSGSGSPAMSLHSTAADRYCACLHVVSCKCRLDKKNLFLPVRVLTVHGCTSRHRRPLPPLPSRSLARSLSLCMHAHSHPLRSSHMTLHGGLGSGSRGLVTHGTAASLHPTSQTFASTASAAACGPPRSSCWQHPDGRTLLWGLQQMGVGGVKRGLGLRA